MDLSHEEYFKVLIHNYLSNQASDKDKEDLVSWINHSDANRKLFTEYSRVWMLTSQAAPRGKFNKEKYNEWNKLSAMLNMEDNKVPVVSLSLFDKLLRVAAVFLLLFSVTAAIAWMITSNRLENIVSREIVHQINVPKGSKSEVILPDGTQVNLNAGSSLSYNGDFGLSSREVFLEGEAYFDVETNDRMAFIVNASGLKIKALGTVFNVKAYPEEESVTTTLVEGIVKIEGEGVDYTMTPRQKITYVKAEGKQMIPLKEKSEKDIKTVDKGKKHDLVRSPQVRVASNVDTYELTAWKDGRLVFNAEKLSTLAVLVERKFNVSIDIESEELQDYRFTGTFYKETLEQILDIINLSAPIKYEIREGIVKISLDPKRKSVFKEVISN